MALLQSQCISTVEDPIKFFQAFFEFDYLEILRNNFMPDQNDPTDWNNKFDVDFEKETFTVEHLVEIAGHAEDDGYGDEFWVVDETKYESKTYSFKEFLDKRFDFEFHKTRDFIDHLIPSLPTSESAELLCRVLIDKLLFFIEKSKDEKFINYKEQVIYIEDIIRLLYNKYYSFCKVYKNSIRLKNIVNQVTTSQVIPNKKFKNNIYKSLAKLEFEDEYLLEYDHYNPTETEKVENALWSIMHNDSKSAEILLNFVWDNRPVCYLLRKLNQHEELMNLVNIDKSQKVQIKGNAFSAGASYVAATRIEKNPGKFDELKKYIDTFITDHLV